MIDDGPYSSSQGRSAIDGVMSLALCPLLVSQALQYFRSSEMQPACDGCFARKSICSVIFFDPGMSRAVHDVKLGVHNNFGVCHGLRGPVSLQSVVLYDCGLFVSMKWSLCGSWNIAFSSNPLVVDRSSRRRKSAVVDAEPLLASHSVCTGPVA